MKKRLSIVMFAVTVAVVLQGCVGFTIVRGSGQVVEQERSVSGFDEVALTGQGTLHIQVGRKESLRIEAERNLMRYLVSEVVGGDRLRIGVQDGVLLHSTRPIHYYLTVVDLNTLVVSGSGTVIAPDLKASTFDVTISGSGEVEMDELRADDVRFRISGSGDLVVDELDADTLDVVISGSGNLDIDRGDAKEQAVTISGSGTYAARGLESEQARARISGSGTATIQVTETLDAHISGSGDVRYLGRPAVETKVSGSGDVEYIGG